MIAKAVRIAAVLARSLKLGCASLATSPVCPARFLEDGETDALVIDITYTSLKVTKNMLRHLLQRLCLSGRSLSKRPTIQEQYF
jgi:hypothetical protein